MNSPRLTVLFFAIGLGVLLGCFATVLGTMFISGLSPSYSTLVVTNRYGEYYFEIALLLVGLICFIVSMRNISFEVNKK